MEGSSIELEELPYWTKKQSDNYYKSEYPIKKRQNFFHYRCHSAGLTLDDFSNDLKVRQSDFLVGIKSLEF